MSSPMETVAVAGAEALARIDQLRSAWVPGAPYPFLIGDKEELEEFQDFLELPSDGGASILNQAGSVDTVAWLKEHISGSGKSWPKQEIPKQTNLVSLYDVLTNEIKPEVYVGLVRVDAPHELFAKLGFGGWNDCPEPHIHVALHRYWKERFNASPVAISQDIVECFVLAPPKEKPEALELAREQNAYCYDIVEQGVGTVSKLGSGLLGSNFWYFWWD